MKRRHSAIDNEYAATAAATTTITASTSTPAKTAVPRQPDKHHDVSDTEVTDVEEHSALEVEVDREDEVLDSLKFVKKDRLRWLTQASSTDTIMHALDRCGLNEGDALSRKRRRYQRKPQAGGPCSSRALGKRKRTSPYDSWRADQDDPLTKLRVFKSLKKGKRPATRASSEDSVSDIEASMINIDEKDDDERMELSDIDWYTRQTNEKGWDHEDEDDDLDMSEVELGVMASPSPQRRHSPEPEPYKPIVSFAEVNNVPSCLYRPLADIIDEVYTNLGLDTDDRRGVKMLHDMLGDRRPSRTRKELGSVGVFPTRPTAAQDWAALNLTRKIIRRDRLAKSTIYRFTFVYPKESVPARFLEWQTANHPTLSEIRQGLRLKLDELEADRSVEIDLAPTPPHAPSSPGLVEEDLDDEVDDILSEVDSLNEEGEGEDEESEAEMTEVDEGEDDDVETEVDEGESDAGTSEVSDARPPIEPLRSPSPAPLDNDNAAEDEAFYAALGLAESPRRIATLPRPTAIYSRLTRTAPESPPGYTERMYRDRSPTPPPPFNAQTDNTVVIPPRFSPAAVVPAVLPRLLPPFAVSPTPSPSRRRTRPTARVTSGEIIMPGSYARPAPRPAPTPSVGPVVNSFDLALDMEEAETQLELAELPASDAEANSHPEGDVPATATAGLVSWGTSLVRSWWSR